MNLSRRNFLISGSAFPFAGQSVLKPGKRPNVLIVLADQHGGRYMSCAGHQVKTPNLDQLANDGVRFSNAVSNNPVCSPMRAMFMTGEYWFKNGVFCNDQPVRDDLPGFAEVFANSGYATGYAGKWHIDGGRPKKLPGGFVPPSRRKGWQEWHGYEKGHDFDKVWDMTEEGRRSVPGYDWEPEWHTDLALDFIKRHKNQPWTYMVSYGPPHLPEECPRKFLDLYPLENIQLTPAQERNIHSPEEHQRMLEMMQMYMGLVSSVDHEVGRLIDGLQNLGMEENTLVVYMGDHGDVLGTHSYVGVKEQAKYKKGSSAPSFRGKACPSMYALNIPLILKQPSVIKPSQVVKTPISVIDFAPTLLRLAGLPVPETMVGSDRSPWCIRGEAPEKNTIYLGRAGKWSGLFDGRWLFGEGAIEPYRVLFDLQNDPQQLNNLYETRPEEVMAFRRKLVDLAKTLGENPKQLRLLRKRMTAAV